MADHSANIHHMLAALNFGVVVLSIAAGGLTASLVGLVVGSLLSMSGVENGPGMGLVVGIVAGLFVAGWVAGARSVHSHRFHGMISGLLLSFLIVIVARLGGSVAPTSSVIWLAILSIAISGLAGWLAGRRRAKAGRP
ncbi:MAG: hypothetical protein WCE80_06835 [Acidimicrobiia bacterium]